MKFEDVRAFGARLTDSGYPRWASQIDEVVARGATGSEILMGLRWTLSVLINDEPDLPAALRTEAHELIRAVNSALAGEGTTRQRTQAPATAAVNEQQVRIRRVSGVRRLLRTRACYEIRALRNDGGWDVTATTSPYPVLRELLGIRHPADLEMWTSAADRAWDGTSGRWTYPFEPAEPATNAVGPLYLSSLESTLFGPVRRCDVLRSLTFATGKPAVLAEISPGLVGQDFGSGRDITRVVLSARQEGESVDPITSFPCFVHISIAAQAEDDLQSPLHAEDLTIIGWGELYRTEDDARSHRFD